MNLADLTRHADNTLTKFRAMTPREQEMALRRLVKMRDELEAERDELALELDEQYDELTPAREQKSPKGYEKRFGNFHGNLALYERTEDIIGRINRVLSDWEVKSVKNGKEAYQADEATPRYEARPLSALHG